jgi:hypothetical protein
MVAVFGATADVRVVHTVQPIEGVVFATDGAPPDYVKERK